jgi:hypothetical protein
MACPVNQHGSSPGGGRQRGRRGAAGSRRQQGEEGGGELLERGADQGHQGGRRVVEVVVFPGTLP